MTDDEQAFREVSEVGNTVLDAIEETGVDTRTALAALGAVVNTLLDDFPPEDRLEEARRWVRCLLDQVGTDDQPDA
jgi:hypothetical protein